VIDENQIYEFLRLNGDRLHHREGQELEFKEQFNLAALADYFKDFSAFANNRGGYLIFGVKDKPRTLSGMSDKSIAQFEKIDPQIISGHLQQIFSSEIRWAQCMVKIDGMYFGVFRIEEARSKPIIARKDEGKDNLISSGEIYYRYGGRTQKILGSELESIINHRIEQNNKQWIDLVQKIGRAGPENAAILDSEKSIIEKGQAQILVLDEALASKLKFVREGHFVEKDGAPTLKLVGDVTQVDRVEVIQHVKENLTKTYPLSANEMAALVKEQLPSVGRNEVWRCLSENNIKNNPTYSAYNFRNKAQEDMHNNHGQLPVATPVIYNRLAVDYVVNILKNSVDET